MTKHAGDRDGVETDNRWRYSQSEYSPKHYDDAMDSINDDHALHKYGSEFLTQDENALSEGKLLLL